jgi:EAL domain-containing protein (putative c-di-GMP-specific phosphodiesterase class I)
MEARLRRALDRDEFVLHYQPKVALRDGRITSMEALIRWQSRELGLVQPSQFIPLLEESGLIVEAGAWALRRAAADHARWAGTMPHPPRIAVNVSVAQLQRPDFVDVATQAAIAGDGGCGIDIEITESVLIGRLDESIAKLTALRERGMGVSIDDFGTGYSSLAYIASLPLTALKIDRAFIAKICGDSRARRLVATMIDLAHSLSLAAIAEGVETREQANALRAMGCDEIQGFLASRPLPFADATSLVRAARPVLLEPA